METLILKLFSSWPVTTAFLDVLPVGDLINLSRTSSSLRAALHGFEEPESLHQFGNISQTRPSLHIGAHQSYEWKQLKKAAAFACSSSTHTRGSDVKPCHYCSRLICGACMARSSFANPGENTFKNRRRSFCMSCWESGNKHKRQKLSSPVAKDALHALYFGPEVHLQTDATKFCECTNSRDGWVCLECKQMQNKTDPFWTDQCYGEGCSNKLGIDADRRRMCMWCDRPLPPQVTRENRHVWNQKLIDARLRNEASRQADYEEYVRGRRRQLKISPRELRGAEFRCQGPLAHIPVYVRHLDTINYQRYMERNSVPAPESVYNSKWGKWRYSPGFLLAFRKRCSKIVVSDHIKNVTKLKEFPFARTNQEKLDQLSHHEKKRLDSSRQGKRVLRCSDFGGTSNPNPNRAAEWHELRAKILHMNFVDHLSIAEIQKTLMEDYNFFANMGRYSVRIAGWMEEKQLPRHYHSLPRSSVDGHPIPPEVDNTGDALLAKSLQEEFDRDVAEILQAEWNLEHSDNGNGEISPRAEPNKRRAESDEEDLLKRTEQFSPVTDNPPQRRRTKLHHSPSLEIRLALAAGTHFPQRPEVMGAHRTTGDGWDVADELGPYVRPTVPDLSAQASRSERLGDNVSSEVPEDPPGYFP